MPTSHHANVFWRADVGIGPYELKQGYRQRPARKFLQTCSFMYTIPLHREPQTDDLHEITQRQGHKTEQDRNRKNG